MNVLLLSFSNGGNFSGQGQLSHGTFDRMIGT